MNFVNSKNIFRKNPSSNNENKENFESNISFRKNIDVRLATPLRENSLERIPGHDMITIKK